MTLKMIKLMFPAEEEKWRGINTRIKYLLLDDVKNINYPEAPSGVTKKKLQDKNGMNGNTGTGKWKISIIIPVTMMIFKICCILLLSHTIHPLTTPPSSSTVEQS